MLVSPPWCSSCQVSTLDVLFLKTEAVMIEAVLSCVVGGIMGTIGSVEFFAPAASVRICHCRIQQYSP